MTMGRGYDWHLVLGAWGAKTPDTPLKGRIALPKIAAESLLRRGPKPKLTSLPSEQDRCPADL